VVRDILNNLSRIFERTAHLPEDLSQGNANRPDSLVTASLVITLIAQQSGSSTAAAPLMLAWVERHRATVAVILGLLVVAVLVGSILVTFGRKTLTTQTIETMMGLARRHYDVGQYEEALHVYEEIRKGSQHRLKVDFAIANTHFRLGDYPAATNAYQQILLRHPDHVPAMMNLGLTLFHMKKHDEAMRTYQQVADRHALSHPPIAERARIAMSLIEEQRRYGRHAN
jgi:tetratricopeptide (TPR) repeat protein